MTTGLLEGAAHIGPAHTQVLSPSQVFVCCLHFLCNITWMPPTFIIVIVAQSSCNSTHRITNYMWLCFPVTGALTSSPGDNCSCRATASNSADVTEAADGSPSLLPSEPCLTSFNPVEPHWDFTLRYNIPLHAAGKTIMCVRSFLSFFLFFKGLGEMHDGKSLNTSGSALYRYTVFSLQ